MTRRLKSLACAGLVAAALPAMAVEVIETTRYYVVPATTDAYTYYTAPSAASDTRTYYYVTEGPHYVTQVPVTEVIYTEPAITVEAPRLTEDQRITNDVVDVLAHDRYLSGRIGVETYDRDVTLSGSVTTPGQVRRAVRNAQGVPGVDHVTSELRPKVGANTSY
ncbi:MAG TPA: BON domain-containing protein [Usitatibacter sp.]|nr:BON domain-containing protein [Usitatibacter sp.]